MERRRLAGVGRVLVDECGLARGARVVGRGRRRGRRRSIVEFRGDRWASRADAHKNWAPVEFGFAGHLFADPVDVLEGDAADAEGLAGADDDALVGRVEFYDEQRFAGG